jgi:hypothetical protein
MVSPQGTIAVPTCLVDDAGRVSAASGRVLPRSSSTDPADIRRKRCQAMSSNINICPGRPARRSIWPAHRCPQVCGLEGYGRVGLYAGSDRVAHRAGATLISSTRRLSQPISTSSPNTGQAIATTTPTDITPLTRLWRYAATGPSPGSLSLRGCSVSRAECLPVRGAGCRVCRTAPRAVGLGLCSAPMAELAREASSRRSTLPKTTELRCRAVVATSRPQWVRLRSS